MVGARWIKLSQCRAIRRQRFRLVVDRIPRRLRQAPQAVTHRTGLQNLPSSYPLHTDDFLPKPANFSPSKCKPHSKAPEHLTIGQSIDAGKDIAQIAEDTGILGEPIVEAAADVAEALA